MPRADSVGIWVYPGDMILEMIYNGLRLRYRVCISCMLFLYLGHIVECCSAVNYR